MAANAGSSHGVAVAAVVIIFGIAAFQLLLAAGVPLGRAAWGGAHRQLPGRLRVASAIAVALWVVAASTVLERGGHDVGPISAEAARWAIWIIVALLGSGAILNVASSSPWERFLWAPIALIAACSCAFVAMGDAASSAVP